MFEYLPWDAVGEEDLQRLLYELIGRVAGPVEQWRAVFRVGGIDLEGSVLRMGNVALYDPGVYDFGEGRWRFLEKEPDGPYAVARVKVEADGTVTNLASRSLPESQTFFPLYPLQSAQTRR